jgi:hypothetical protein
MPSTWESEFTHGTYLESTKCFPALELIDSSKVWEVPSENQSAKLQELPLEIFSFPLESMPTISSMLKKLLEDLQWSSQADKQLLWVRSSVSPSITRVNITNFRRKERSFLMVSTSKSSLLMAHSVDWHSSNDELVIDSLLASFLESLA